MFRFLFGQPATKIIPRKLFENISAQSRSVTFYSQMGVPDTVVGRYDMLTLHTYLFSRRLRKETDSLATSLSQDIFDCFVEEIDRALRELGIGDTTVPKRKKRMIRGFYGQIDDFDGPLDRGDGQQLEGAVRKRFLEGEEKGSDLLCQYIVKAEDQLSLQSLDCFVKGELEWPNMVLSND